MLVEVANNRYLRQINAGARARTLSALGGAVNAPRSDMSMYTGLFDWLTDMPARTVSLMPPGSNRAAMLSRAYVNSCGTRHPMIVRPSAQANVPRQLSWGDEFHRLAELRTANLDYLEEVDAMMVLVTLAYLHLDNGNLYHRSTFEMCSTEDVKWIDLYKWLF